MFPLVLLFAISLLHSYEAQGSGAVTPVFVLTGKDLLLDVLSPVVLEEEDEFRWKFALNKKQEESVMRVSYNHKTRIFGRYKGRAAISLQNYSLHLRNMQQADSGLYSAKIERDEDELVGEYNVTVQDPVSPVELTVEFASNSSDSCILTVTCCTRVSDHINSILRCVNSTCSLNGGEMSKVTASGASLKIYLVDGTISCSHSNEVSSSIKVMEEVQQFCQTDAVGNVAIIVAPAVTSAMIGAVALSLCIFIKWKIKSCKHTVDDVPQDINPVQGLSPTATHAVVSFHTRPVQSAETQDTVPPETVYAQVYRAAKDKVWTPTPTTNT
ncbi:SLAM family member 9-like [Scophthalmus maximus]|uniref:SLAM family member 9-like n=1 Tax=Scophthalmus maximus TaxID=52904 RepID=UPI0015E0E4E6|nr:SLAM family member 9-like [Scophthalmus maximus]